MPRSFHHDEKYMGHNNQEIKELRKKIRALEKEIKEVEQQIENIQSKCEHYYQFSSGGPYEDNYNCKFCGHDTEH